MEISSNLYNFYLYVFKFQVLIYYVRDMCEVHESKLYDSGTRAVQYRSRPGRYGVCQGKGKFGKLEGSHAVLFMVPLNVSGARST